ncbi:transcription termination factor 3, mitochondrial [Periplaneta americana]|uniref:transcription termination factor 3, mitochondrial n=1 Tax=Periplaneta americana TaxID=6978 RepID=UPI0037E8921B
MRAFMSCIQTFLRTSVTKIGMQNRRVEIYRIFSYRQLQTIHDKLNVVSHNTSDSISKESSSQNEDEVFAVQVNSDITKERLQQSDYSVIEPCSEDISTIAPYYKPSFNFAAYVNKSPTLQQLVKLGVDLHKLEGKKNVPEFILRLEFDRDMKEHIRLLHDFGVPSDELGAFLTKNPMIFKEDLDNLQVRVNYLQYKKFSNEVIAHIIKRNPFWLSHSTEEIDERLGHFQVTFKLSGDQVREVAKKSPKLITYDMTHIKVNTFSVKEEMGFNEDEMRALLLKVPKLWMKNNKNLVSVFDYAHNTMKLPHQQIVAFPHILVSRIFRVKQRHLFLQLIGRAQYNPNMEGYISPKDLVSGTDTEFCQIVAKSSVESFNVFLKTI